MEKAHKRTIIHPSKIRPDACVGAVSLSIGVLGEPFAEHEVKLIEERLPEDFGLSIKYMPNAKKGIEFLTGNPDKKAEDLKSAFLDSKVDIVWNALGGDDTFRTLPYLLNDEFAKIVTENPKPFIGFSDTTNNHLMFYKLGLATFYGPALLSDVAELGDEILPYTKEWIEKLLNDEKNIVVESSPVWYGGRADFGPEELGKPLPEHEEKHGHEYLFGEGVVEGLLLGGCIDSLYEMIAFGRYGDQKEVYEKYPILPEKEEWRGKVIFLESSEEKPEPEKLRKMLETLQKETNMFSEAAALIIGKPMDETYYDEYKEIYQELAEKYELPTVFNLNFGHANPRMMIPYDMPMRIDFDEQKITLPGGLLKS